MKLSFFPVFGIASLLAITACDRVSMEMSPEALVSYGLPSQKSNTEKSEGVQKEQKEAKIGSSAILTKPRTNY